MAKSVANDRMTLIAADMVAECKRATRLFGPFGSGHEGYAVILEELDELWAEIKSKKSNARTWRNEAIQIGAMAIRFIFDLTFPGADEKD